MITINKQDIYKTLIILWFVLTTAYVLFDQYQSYKVKGIEAAYKAGYADSVEQLINQVEKNGCSAIDVHKNEKKVNIVNAECLQSSQSQQAIQTSNKNK